MLDDRKLRIIDRVRLSAPRPRSATVFESLHEVRVRVGHPLRVGVLRVDGIGDWLLTLPLVAALQASEDVSAVTLVSVPGYEELLTRGDTAFAALDLWSNHHTPWPHGDAGKVLAMSFVGQRRALAAGRRLHGAFDLVVLPRWDTDRGQNLRFAALGTGAYVAGHDPALQPQATGKERVEGRILSLVCRDEREHALESERLSALAEALGVAEPATAGPVRRLLGLGEDVPRTAVRRVVLHTSAHDDFRRWPVADWSDLVRRLLDVLPDEVVLVGSPADRAEHGRLIAIDPRRVRSVAGEASLAALADVMDGASLFVGNDSGPAHLAAAVGVPTVVISCFPDGDDPGHPNSPDRFAPRAMNGLRIVRPPAQPVPFAQLSTTQRAGVIGGVGVEEVFTAATTLIRGGIPD